MRIRLYNTLSRQIEDFEPLIAGQVRMYTCGPTVYDFGHIGNFRTFVAVDLLRRFLATQKLAVTAVMNITDVDDKTIRRSQEAGEDLAVYTARYEKAFIEDCDLLSIAPPTHLVRATAFIPQMVAWIVRLVENGNAYVNEGSVYFRVASFPAYGRLSGRDLAGLQDGARVEVDEYGKEQARDFVLWKAQRPGEPAWPSPWGPGRPGWHIECSVMATEMLGESFDLHAAGTDLIFPHHENEIAQAESLTHRPFVKYWVHAEFLQVNGEKMSKSLGNFYTLRDLLQQGHRPSAIRYLLAQVPYGHQLNFTLDGLIQAGETLERLRAFRARLAREATSPESHPALQARVRAAETEMLAALADNLNTAEALGALFKLVREANVALDAGQIGQPDRAAFDAVLQTFDSVFCVLDDTDRAKMDAVGLAAAGLSDAEIETLLAERAAARQRKDFTASDDFRRRLDEGGVLVEDVRGGGVRWRRR